MGEHATTFTPADLMHEKEVMKRYRHLFAERELLEARKRGEIRFFDLRKGPHYSNEQLVAYLASKERNTCQEENKPIDPDKPAPGPEVQPTPSEEKEKAGGFSKSETTGSETRPGASISSITGMTKELEERAARQLESET